MDLALTSFGVSTNNYYYVGTYTIIKIKKKT